MNTAAIDQPAGPSSMDGRKMRSIVQDAYGSDPDGVLRLAEVARPAIGPDEVLVRVIAASIDLGTWHLLTGMPYAMRLAGFGVRAPKAPNPGRAFAGTVDQVGPTVVGFAPGDEVYGSSDGSFAEYVRVDVGQLARKPANLTFESAATVPISGGTALQAVRRANVQPGQKVLVIGASGGVGTFAVQIARAIGAEVTGVGSTAKLDVIRAAGADHVVDYSRGAFLEGDERYDAIIDIGGSSRLRHLRRALTPKGALVIVGGETRGRVLGGFGRSLRATVLSPVVSQSLAMLVSTENAGDLDALRDLVEAGRVAPVVERTYPLSEVAAAIRHVSEGRARGKVAVAVSA